jgi:hypothetical protein
MRKNKNNTPFTEKLGEIAKRRVFYTRAEDNRLLWSISLIKKIEKRSFDNGRKVVTEQNLKFKKLKIY